MATKKRPAGKTGSSTSRSRQQRRGRFVRGRIHGGRRFH